MPHFMGSLQQCLANLVERYSTQLPRPIMAEFCGVVESTVLSWLRGDNLPVGLPLFRLRVFLQLAGYRVDELDLLNRQTRQLGEIIALDLMTPEAVRETLDYKNVQDVYRFVREGSTGPTRRRQLKLERLLETYNSEREKQLAVWQGRIRNLFEDAEVSGRKCNGAPDQQSASSVTAQGTTSVVFISNEAEVAEGLMTALGALLDNGDHHQGPLMPGDGNHDRRQAIVDRVGRERLRTLIEQLKQLD